MGTAVEWAGSPLLYVIREHHEIAKKVMQEEGGSRSAGILVDIARSGLISISSGEERKGQCGTGE
jgi:hypothetical protein